MKKTIVLILISVLCVLLDNSLVPFFAIRGFYPSMALTFMICYSIVNGSWEGVWLGAGCGLLQDVFFGSALGVNAFSNIMVCLAAGIIGANIFKEKKLIPVISTFFLSILKGLIVVLILYLFKQIPNYSAVLYVAVYNLIVGIFMYRAVFKLCQKRYMKIKWKF